MLIVIDTPPQCLVMAFGSVFALSLLASASVMGVMIGPTADIVRILTLTRPRLTYIQLIANADVAPDGFTRS